MKQKSKFPVRTIRRTTNKTIETLDTGLYIRRRTTTRGVNSNDEPENPLESIAAIETQAQKCLMQSKLPKHIRDDLNHLLYLTTESTHFIKSKDIESAAAYCLQVGALYEQIRISGIESIFASGRLALEGSRKPRGLWKQWQAVFNYLKTNPNAKPREIFHRAYIPAGGKAEYHNFRTELYHKRKKKCVDNP